MEIPGTSPTRTSPYHISKQYTIHYLHGVSEISATVKDENTMIPSSSFWGMLAWAEVCELWNHQ